MMLVDVDALFKVLRIRLGVELRGIDVLTPADHLKRAGVRGHRCTQPSGRVLHGFFMADKGFELPAPTRRSKGRLRIFGQWQSKGRPARRTWLC